MFERIRAAATTLLLAASVTSAGAAVFPDRPLKLVVPYAPGGSTDLVSRTAAKILESVLNVPVVVENRPGANTIVAAKTVAASPADGYTLLVAGTASTNVNHLLYQQLPYDIDRDFTPVGMLSRMPYAVFVNPGLGVDSPAQLAQRARDQPGGLNYGPAGNGNPMHMAALMFAAGTAATLVQVPYQGSAPALNALIAGEVDVTFDVLGTALPFVESGRIKLLAVATKERIERVPHVPTMIESGLEDYVVETGFAVLAPAATPAATIERLNEALNEVLESPEFKEAIRRQTLIGYPRMSVAQTQRELLREREKWGRLIKAHQITLD